MHHPCCIEKGNLKGSKEFEGTESAAGPFRSGGDEDTVDAKSETIPAHPEAGDVLRGSAFGQGSKAGGAGGYRMESAENTRVHHPKTTNLVPVKRRMSVQDIAADVVEKVRASKVPGGDHVCVGGRRAASQSIFSQTCRSQVQCAVTAESPK